VSVSSRIVRLAAVQAAPAAHERAQLIAFGEAGIRALNEGPIVYRDIWGQEVP